MLRTRTPDRPRSDQNKFAFRTFVPLLACWWSACGPISYLAAQTIKSARVVPASRDTLPSVPTVDSSAAKARVAAVTKTAAAGSPPLSHSTTTRRSAATRHSAATIQPDATTRPDTTTRPAATMHSGEQPARGRFFTASSGAWRATSRASSADPVPISDPDPSAPFASPVDGGPPAGPGLAGTADALHVVTNPSTVMDGRAVACQAACCWPLARFLEERAATIRSEAVRGFKKDDGSAALSASFLRRQAARQRDIAAASALRTYYSWIANREQLAFAAAGLELVREQSATQAALTERGIAIEDPTELERKRLELRDNQLQLESNDLQLAQTLLRLTCCASDPRTAAVEGLEVQPTSLPCDQLVDFALRHRQDYLAYVELCQCLDEQSAGAVADLLSPLAGGVGLGMLDLKCLEKLCLTARGSETLSHVSRELRSAIDLQRRLIQQTVCDKCHALTLAYERVAIAEQTLATWNQRIAGLSRLEQLGDARGQSLFAARGEQLRAQSTLISRRLSAKLAEIDLAEAMGDLAPRCCRGDAWLVTSN